MLSVCIPNYCYDAFPLVEALHMQKLSLIEPVQIILIDDGSSEYWRKKNAKISHFAQYIELEKNIGRAAIRNLFLQYCVYDYLLFLDSDVLPVDSTFLKNYIKNILDNPNINVICGGIKPIPHPPEKEKYLRWYYGIKRECLPLEMRQQNPYRSFMTGNFCIQKNAFKSLRFNENLTQYGHEDTLFGYHLWKKGYSILHIDNPVYHMHIENSNIFLDKTEKAIENLFYIAHEILNNEKDFIKQNKLLKWGYILKKTHLIKWFYFIFSILRKKIRKLLTSQNVNIRWFDFYKLGYMCEVILEKAKNKK